MKDKQIVDLQASIRRRLLNLSRSRGEDFQLTLTRKAASACSIDRAVAEPSVKSVQSVSSVIQTEVRRPVALHPPPSSTTRRR